MNKSLEDQKQRFEEAKRARQQAKKAAEEKREEIDAYEKSLKDRKMPVYMTKNDPYGINLVRNNVEELIKKEGGRNAGSGCERKASVQASKR